MWLQKDNTVLHSKGTSESFLLAWVTPASFFSTWVCNVKKAKVKNQAALQGMKRTSSWFLGAVQTLQSTSRLREDVSNSHGDGCPSTAILVLPHSSWLLSGSWEPLCHRSPYWGKIQSAQISVLLITHEDFRPKQIYWLVSPMNVILENASGESRQENCTPK